MAKTHDVELIMVGDELLRGDRTDSHGGYIGRRLLEIGVRVGAAHIVGDDRAEIAGAVKERIRAADALIVTGGIGPTHDDVTREAVSEALGLPLEFDGTQWERIRAYFERLGRTASESNRRQAMFPKGATPIENARGTAPGFSVEALGCLVFVLPGPPGEFRAMVERAVLPALSRRFTRPPLFSRVFRTTGVGESQMAALLDSLSREFGEFTLASLPHTAGVDLILRAKPGAVPLERIEETAARFEAKLRQGIGRHIYEAGDRSIEEIVGLMLTEREATIAVAESLTGGLVAKRLTDFPGSSRYTLAGVVAYSNESKVELLGVRRESLAAYGAVSEAVCREMADGIRSKTGATWGLSTTGIAGPGGGSAEKPVGICYYAVGGRGGCDVRRRVFGGSRGDVRERVAWAVLFLLYEKLLESEVA